MVTFNNNEKILLESSNHERKKCYEGMILFYIIKFGMILYSIDIEDKWSAFLSFVLKKGFFPFWAILSKHLTYY